jgi:hypothetical protein
MASLVNVLAQAQRKGYLNFWSKIRKGSPKNPAPRIEQVLRRKLMTIGSSDPQ